MRWIKGFIVFLLAIAGCQNAEPHTTILPLERDSTDTAQIAVPEGITIYDSTLYPAQLLADIRRMEGVKNIQIMKDYFVMNGRDTIGFPNDLLLDSTYTLIAKKNNQKLKIELVRKNNSEIDYHISVLENERKALFSEYGTVSLSVMFYLASEVKDDDEGMGFLCTPYGNNQQAAHCLSICIGREGNDLKVLLEPRCPEYGILNGFPIPKEVSKDEFFRRIVVVTDSADYSLEFLNWWRRYHQMDELVETRKGYMLLGTHDTLAFPAQIQRGKSYLYEAAKGDTTQRLVLKRKNSTTLLYDMSLIKNAKKIWGENGEVHFDAGHF